MPTITTTVRTIEKVVEDCRDAGADPDSDPAAVLLARHMAVVSTNRRPRAVLRQACNRRLEDLTRFPTLLALAIRGVEYDVVAKACFHLDATAAMAALADVLELAAGTFEVVSIQGAETNPVRFFWPQRRSP